MTSSFLCFLRTSTISCCSVHRTTLHPEKFWTR